jgi:hypothetical protein
LLFIGNSELFRLIPHLLHFKKRSIIYEPFIIKKDIKDYFRYFKIGPPEKNLIVFSPNLKRQDKLNIKYCRDLGIETKSVDEFNEDNLDFSSFITEATDYYNSNVKRKVNDVLERYKNYF